MTDSAVLIPQLYVERIVTSGKNSGTLDLKLDAAEDLAVVDGYRPGTNGSGRTGLSDAPGRHHLGAAPTHHGAGLWFRVDPRLHISGTFAAQARLVVGLDTFRAHVVGGDWTYPGPCTLAVTVALGHDGTPFEDDDDLPGYVPVVAWRLNADEGTAEMLATNVMPEDADPLDVLGDAWPLDTLAAETVALLGVGSIGAAAAEALIGYGVRRLVLIDPDRLFWHNLARHRAGARYLGRYKVNAMADELRQRDGRVEVEPLRLDVIYDADHVRPVLDEVSAVLISSDGIDSRRAADLLARRAGKPAIFACVLADGAYGEILRLRPPRVGCLACVRVQLVADGVMDAEPWLDRGYGEGTRHLPMTAVRSDLALLGQLAAKVTTATLLERHGHFEQRLPGDHLVTALRPKPGLLAPFDLVHTGAQRWRALPAPRPECPVCGRNARVAEAAA